MANFKKKSDKDVVETLIEEVEVEKEEPVEILLDEKDEVPPVEDITVEKPVDNKPSKKYTVKVKQYTRVFIGQWFTFEPNKVYRVDENVKSKLQNAGLLLPL